ncbi:MAG: M36 family metallopeptidase, partial [Candidatus Krumholzibacteriia bacterium]
MIHAGRARIVAATWLCLFLVLAALLPPLHALLALHLQVAPISVAKGSDPPSSVSGARAAAPHAPFVTRFDAQGRLRRLYFPDAGPGAGFLAGSVEERARQLLQREAPRLAGGSEPLELVEVRWSPSGPHVRFRQVSQGVPIWGAEAVVSFDRELQPTVLASDLVVVPGSLEHTATLAAERALRLALSRVQVRSALHAPAQAELLVRAFGAGWRLAYRVRFACEVPMGDWEVWIDARSGSVLELRDRTLHQRSAGGLTRREAGPSQDIDGQGRVFLPDPVIASGDPTLSDQDDSDAAVPGSTYELVPLQDLDAPVGGWYHLAGPHVRVEDWESPPGAPDSSATPEFLFTRAQQGFEDVMVYYHIDTMQRWYQKLGFPDANNRQQPADAHGFYGLDNSKYVPSLRKLSFGEGGVDDAEDAAVIVHEYGHATQHDIVPTWGIGGHERAMGEGFGDYLANSYAWSMRPQLVQAWNGVFQWDGHNEFWPGRLAIDPTKSYPQDAGGPVHAAGTLWCSALTDALYSLGDRTVMDRLVLDHHYALTGSATMEDAANAILAADVALHDGMHVPRLVEVFAHWGMVDASQYTPVAIEHTPLDIVSIDEGLPEVRARVLSSAAAIDPASVLLAARAVPGPSETVPMQAQGDDLYTTRLPVHPGTDLDLEYSIEARDLKGNATRLPFPGVQSAFAFSMGLVAERFEEPGAWQVGSAQDDALRGIWVRAEPVGTSAQPGADHTHAGSRCFVTGNAAPGAPAGEADVDGGQTTLVSPVYDLRGVASATLRYWLWYTNDQGSHPGEDSWEASASNDAGQTWVTLESATASHAAWQLREFDLGSLFGPLDQLRLRFVASDRDGSSLVEAALDDLTLLVRFTTDAGTGSPRRPLLLSTHPNPFNPRTTLHFRTSRPGHVELAIYDPRGRLVRRLLGHR